MKRLCFILAMLMVLACSPPFSAAATEGAAEDITKQCTLRADGKKATKLTDNNIYTYMEVKELTVSSDEGLYGLYIKFDREPKEWRLKADGAESTQGKDSFLHQYIPLSGEKELVLSFEDSTTLADVFVFGQGAVPDWVHRWEMGTYADIMVCPTHSDDDQLFFAGMLPWCAANGYRVQVVYLTNHLMTHDRPHELLEGIWHCGIKYYPYISEYPDLYANNHEGAVAIYKSAGYTEEDFVEFYVDLLQKYKPLVVAGHDINGEYGHGVHIMNFHALTQAVEESARRGLWDVPKTYIHLWEENRVVFNWDEPMDYFDGKTPFEISQEGFGYHKSQHTFKGIYRWIYGTEEAPVTKAAQLRSNSPCQYGLYRSTVGNDTVENGLFEHLLSYGEQEEQGLIKGALHCLSENRGNIPTYIPPKSVYPLTYSKPTAEESADVAESDAEDKLPQKNKDGNKPKGLPLVIAGAFLATNLGIIAALIRRKKGKNG